MIQSCYNGANTNARAVVQTPASVADINSGLRSIDADMAKPTISTSANPSFDASRYYLGTLCKGAHGYEDSGFTLRRITGKACPKCVSLYLTRNKEKIKLQERERYQRNREARLEGCKRYKAANRELIRQKNSRYKKDHPEIVARHNRTAREKRGLYLRLRTRVYHAFTSFSEKGKVRPADEYGINYAAILQHLGPCPGDRREWHIDHIKPLAWFDFNDPEQIKQAFAPENHQWLPAHDNLSKQARYE
jgi:Zn-finger nucleic acid-binding protein